MLISASAWHDPRGNLKVSYCIHFPRDLSPLWDAGLKLLARGHKEGRGSIQSSEVVLHTKNSPNCKGVVSKLGDVDKNHIVLGFLAERYLSRVQNLGGNHNLWPQSRLTRTR